MFGLILIIDDELDMQIYLRTLFRKAGYETEVAANGEAGVEAAVALRPALITLDLLMPRQSGLLAYSALRTRAETREIPVIILTGLSDHQGLLASLADGVPGPAAVVEKPIQREAFLGIVKEAMGG